MVKMMDENARSSNPLSSQDLIEKALIQSVLESAQQAEDFGLAADQIIVSCKVSSVQSLIRIYEELQTACRYPLHLGLTEAGMGTKGVVASTAALSVLLQQGIGDTIRVSLTPEPNQARTEEVKVAQQILQSLEIQSFKPEVTACPGCGRTTSVFFQELAKTVTEHMERKMPEWRLTHPGVKDMNVAVMGCIVNAQVNPNTPTSAFLYRVRERPPARRFSFVAKKPTPSKVKALVSSSFKYWMNSLNRPIRAC